ncbi:alpha/beta hydrolase [Gandjariella thermophila]|uniref:Alpha/beta hydrolase n=1 Tax=Gandjariella thermophila TaxID=1931992 RepID=A0A4D4J9T6_9PSEU|nr:alpha/beta hydrolase [Gandjariella thermophila]GDY30697.1 alpha/beta hydrolase [Gandjariella thermophila]
MPTLPRSIPYRVQAAVLRAVFALPEPVRRLIAGPPLRIDGQELALDAQLLLRLQSLVEQDGLAADTPEAARAAMAASVPMVAGERIEPVDARDLLIPGDAGPIPARLYQPEGLAEGSPLLVYYHGGGWVIGDLESHDNLCRFLAKHAGVRVLAVDYRLAPEHPFPAAVDDALAAYRYAVAHAEELGVDPARIALGGDSAGGNLAAVTAHGAATRGEPRPTFLLLIYPAVDASTRRRSRELFGHGFLLTDSDMDWFMGHYCPDPESHRDPRLSILLAEDLGVLPPTYLAMSGFDPLRDEDEEFAKRLAESGVSVVVRRHDDLIHGYANMLGVGRRFREAVFEAVGALRAGLALSPAGATGNGGPAAGAAADRGSPGDGADQVTS